MALWDVTGELLRARAKAEGEGVTVALYITHDHPVDRDKITCKYDVW
jgi:hypothetical protein